MSTEDLIVNDIELPEGMSEADFNAIVEEGDPSKIAALMAGKKPEEADGDEEIIIDHEAESEGDTQNVVVTAETKNKQDEQGAPSGAEVADESLQDTKPVVLTKDGKHTMPYSVVEDLRQREQQAREQLAAALAENQQLKGGSAKMQAALKKNGIDVSAIEQGDNLTEEQIEALTELDPSIAEVVRVLNARSQAMAQQLKQIQDQEVVTPLELAIRGNEQLNTWRRTDPDRWQMAEIIDDRLREDPAFANKSLDDRFAEVAKRVNQAFGEAHQPQPTQKTAEEIAAEKIKAASTRQQIPKSLTDVGATPQTERSQQEIALDIQDPDVLAARMANMSKAQLKNFLAGVELVG